GEARIHNNISRPRRDHALVGRVLEPKELAGFRPDRPPIELHRLVAAAVEEEIGLDIHSRALARLGSPLFSARSNRFSRISEVANKYLDYLKVIFLRSQGNEWTSLFAAVSRPVGEALCQPSLRGETDGQEHAPGRDFSPSRHAHQFRRCRRSGGIWTGSQVIPPGVPRPSKKER